MYKNNGMKEKQKMDTYKIKITRNSNVIFVTIPTRLASEPEVHFAHTCNTEVEAELLHNYLLKSQGDRIAEIRRAEFLSGWKHAKAKKHGKKWFSWFKGNFDVTPTNR